jgi:glyoxylate carboligase
MIACGWGVRTVELYDRKCYAETCVCTDDSRSMISSARLMCCTVDKHWITCGAVLCCWHVPGVLQKRAEIET